MCHNSILFESIKFYGQDRFIISTPTVKERIQNFSNCLEEDFGIPILDGIGSNIYWEKKALFEDIMTYSAGDHRS